MKFLLLGFTVTLFFVSCGNGDASKTTTKDQAMPPVAADANYIPPAGVDAKVSASLNPLMNGYLEMKNALAADNSEDAAKAGQVMVDALNSVDTTGMTPEQKAKYNSIAGDIREHAEHIADNGGKIDHQRMHFNMLSDYTYEIAKMFGGGRKLYLTHCPMAREGKGASWLSEFEAIKNPYFGNEMPECGEVKEELK
ncbi:DUF3347 domain-containing protein [Polluticoccus soli]|uniref:DUF3347 domain-containing protein n=1 Tax=Polluticoccus soli TaxID=3034150 RepID=UPI0023E2B913|nr:DUF3347 domain-containing protein [Flavipsychrobacter sp. JY13-12]